MSAKPDVMDDNMLLRVTDLRSERDVAARLSLPKALPLKQ
jgi:hypothetical protein